MPVTNWNKQFKELRYKHKLIFGFVLGMICYSVFLNIWRWNKSVVLYVILIIVICIVILKIRVDLFFKSIEDKKKAGKDHVALIFSKYSFFRNVSYTTTKEKKLKKILENNGIPAANYIVQSPEEFESLLQNPKVKAVIILGHGSRHSFRIKSTIYYYCEFMNKKTNIKYVAQLHCNDNGGKSLYDIIGCEGYDNGKLTHPEDVDSFIESKEFIENLKKYFTKPGQSAKR
jgi:hypothetical protein